MSFLSNLIACFGLLVTFLWSTHDEYAAPMASSELINPPQTNEANGIRMAQSTIDLERYQEAFDLYTEPLTTEEIPNLRIGWYLNDAFGAYSEALEKNQPTVIVFNTDLCVFCRNLLKQMTCPEVNRFAGHMQFAASFTELDEGAAQLEEALGVVRLPTLVVLAPNSERIHVAGRAEGDVGASEVERVLLVGGDGIGDFDVTELLPTLEVVELTERLGLIDDVAEPLECPSMIAD